MEKDWAALTPEQRGEFAAWQEQRTAEAKAKALAGADLAARPKLYADMDEAEKLAFMRRHGLPPRRDTRGRQVPT